MNPSNLILASVRLPKLVWDESQLVANVNRTFLSVGDNAEVTRYDCIASPKFQVDGVGCAGLQCEGFAQIEVVVTFIV